MSLLFMTSHSSHGKKAYRALGRDIGAHLIYMATKKRTKVPFHGERPESNKTITRLAYGTRSYGALGYISLEFAVLGSKDRIFGVWLVGRTVSPARRSELQEIGRKI